MSTEAFDVECVCAVGRYKNSSPQYLVLWSGHALPSWVRKKDFASLKSCLGSLTEPSSKALSPGVGYVWDSAGKLTEFVKLPKDRTEVPLGLLKVLSVFSVSFFFTSFCDSLFYFCLVLSITDTYPNPSDILSISTV